MHKLNQREKVSFLKQGKIGIIGKKKNNNKPLAKS